MSQILSHYYQQTSFHNNEVHGFLQFFIPAAHM
jgi:hypothetical protein